MVKFANLTPYALSLSWTAKAQIQLLENTCLTNPRLVNARCNNAFFINEEHQEQFLGANSIDSRHKSEHCLADQANQVHAHSVLTKCRHNWSQYEVDENYDADHNYGYTLGEEAAAVLSIDMADDIVYEVNDVVVWEKPADRTTNSFDVFVKVQGEDVWSECPRVQDPKYRNKVAIFDCEGQRANRIKLVSNQKTWGFISVREVDFIGDVASDDYMTPSTGPKTYEEYTFDDSRPVCAKHLDDKVSPGFCQLFKSCFPEFNSGKTGSLHCSNTCKKLVNHFPLKMCKEHHKNQIDAAKWTINKCEKKVCWRRTLKHEPICVDVGGFNLIDEKDN